MSQIPSITLKRLTGFGRGKSQQFSQAAIAFGSDTSCEMRFDPTWDKTVSPQHASMRFQNGAWVLIDNSQFGTFVDGQKVTGQATLQPGSTIELGQGGPKLLAEFVASSSVAQAPAAAALNPPIAQQVAEAANQAEPAPAATPEATPANAGGGNNNGSTGRIAVIAAVLIVAIGAGYYFFKDGGAMASSNPDAQLAEIADDYSEAVGLVVLAHPGESEPMATAWALDSHVFATNSHVSEPVKEHLAQGGSAFVILNGRPDKRYKITRAIVHEEYESSELNADGNAPSAITFDVGLLYVEQEVEKTFKIAPRKELEKIGSGYRIAYLGFPMEGMAGNGTDYRNPIATMQSGIVTSFTDYYMAKSDYDHRLLIQHNLGAAGGASGSPMFNAKGEVVAILNAINIIEQVDAATGGSKRAPSAVMVNFAQRVDILKDIYPKYDLLD